MKNLLNRLMNAARHYTISDFVFFKLCLLTIGILLGYYFAAFFSGIIIAIWTIAIISWIVIIARTIKLTGNIRKKD